MSQIPAVSRTPPQLFCLAFGALYVLIGILGFFVPVFSNFASDTNTKLVIFDINPLHNIVHLLIGAALIAGSSKLATARQTNMAVGIAYLAVAVIGLPGVLAFLSINAGLVPDFWLHLLSGLAALAFVRGWANLAPGGRT